MGVHISSGIFFAQTCCIILDTVHLGTVVTIITRNRNNKSGERKLLFDMCVVFHLRGEREAGHGQELIKKVEIRSENQECVVCPKQTETDHLVQYIWHIK